MENNRASKIIKIVVIIAIILAVISLVLPWRGLSMSYSMPGFGSYDAGFNFYPWGGHYYMSMSMSGMYQTTEAMHFDIWSIFYSINIGSNTSALSNQSSGTTTQAFNFSNAGFTVSSIVSFISCIVTIIIGILAIKRFKLCLVAGISAIVSIIAFVVGFSIAFSQDPTGGMISSMIAYTFGFFLMIISAILFFVAFGIKYAVTAMGAGMYPAYGPTQTTGYNYPPKEGFDSKPSYPYPARRKTCPNCGASLEIGSTFCNSCGKKLM